MPEVTILVPCYRTPELLRVCLRLLRRHTDPALARVVVIDNGGDEASLAYLRSLRWIQLCERPPVAGESVAASHAGALARGLREVATPYVLSLHTDTLVRRSGWLELLLEAARPFPPVAGVGTWKMEERGAAWRALRGLQARARRFLGGRPSPRLSGDLDPGERYLRSHCALYRTEPLIEHELRFGAGGGPAGQEMHRRLRELGYATKFLPVRALTKYVLHVNHATMVLHPDRGMPARALARGRRRLARALAGVDAPAVLADASLDA